MGFCRQIKIDRQIDKYRQISKQIDQKPKDDEKKNLNIQVKKLIKPQKKTVRGEERYKRTTKHPENNH